MATNEPKISFDQPRSTFGAWIGIVLLFAIFGLFVWVVMGAMPRGDDYEEKRSQARLEKLKTAREEYAKATQGYGWVDKQKGVARIPVERAMEVSLAELAQRKPAPANPITPAAGQEAGLQVTAPTTAAPAPTAPKTEGTPKATAVTGKDSQTKGQPAAAANPPDAPPGTQPGPNATPAASPGSQTDLAQPEKVEAAAPTPVQKAPGPDLPVPGRDPLPTASPAAPKQP